MELSHFLWIGVSFAVSLFLVWLAWTCFCGVEKKKKGKKGERPGDDDSSESGMDESDSFTSSTQHVITATSR